MKIAILSFFVYFFSCSNNYNSHLSPEKNAVNVINSSLEQEVTIKLGQNIFLSQEDLHIEFVSILSDSRCPLDVSCIWEGNAKIEIKINKTNFKSTSIKLNTSSRFLNEGSYFNYKVKLIDLKPYPRTDIIIKENDYSVTLVVYSE